MGFISKGYSGTTGMLAVFALGCFGQPKSFERAQVKVLGSIDYGQTSAPARLTVRPPYSAYEFNAEAGDRIEVTVRGQGTLQGFLTDAKYQTVAGGSAAFTYTFNPAVEPGTYYILVSETHHRTARFTVELERPSKKTASNGKAMPLANNVTPEYLQCGGNADCVAVEKAGCCHNGLKEAVNTNQLVAYRAANACKDPSRVCAMYMVVDKRVPRCNTALGRCEMLEPSGLDR